MTRPWRRFLLPAGVLVAMWLPLWMGEHPPLYDYPNHLLEAQVLVRYHDERFGYSSYYDIYPAWYLYSNSLSTLLMAGLSTLMPIHLAGKLVLGLYLLLFLGGLWLLLHRRGTTWPLLLLALPLAYNVCFTSGWINFSFAVALSLYGLWCFYRWEATGSTTPLLGLALLLLLIYLAHLFAWLLLLLILYTLSAAPSSPPRRYGPLWLVLNSALPLLLLTRPPLAAIALLLGPVVWPLAGWLYRKRYPVTTLLLGLLVLVALSALAIGHLEPQLRLLLEFRYYLDQKLYYPTLLLTLPHQFLPPQQPLIAYNLAAMLLVLLLVPLLLLCARRAAPAAAYRRSCVALCALALAYGLVPSRSQEIAITEPRVLLLAAMIGLGALRLPAPRDPWRRLTTLFVVTLFVLSTLGLSYYTLSFNRQAARWKAELAQLAPARSLLMLRGADRLPDQPEPLRFFNRFYTGEHFTTLYTIEQGGFTTRAFDNGPLRWDFSVPPPLYDWSHFNSAQYVIEQCTGLRDTYEAVLVWGVPGEELKEALNRCFVAGPHSPDLAIWYSPTFGFPTRPAPEGHARFNPW